MGKSLGRECNFEEVCFEPGTENDREFEFRVGSEEEVVNSKVVDQ